MSQQAGRMNINVSTEMFHLPIFSQFIEYSLKTYINVFLKALVKCNILANVATLEPTNDISQLTIIRKN